MKIGVDLDWPQDGKLSGSRRRSKKIKNPRKPSSKLSTGFLPIYVRTDGPDFGSYLKRMSYDMVDPAAAG
jgi:hypothetical protein